MNPRKIIVLSFITLDGVMQAPGGPEEDTSGDFKFGGWTVPYFDEFCGSVIDEQLSKPFDLLLGRKTYEIFASYWPYHADEPPGPAINRAARYVASRRAVQLTWAGSVLLQGGIVEAIQKLKTQDGPDLYVLGSGNLVQTLLKHDLADEFWLKIFPLTLGAGKRLFAGGTLPAAFKLTESKVSPSGVIIANLARAGEVQTGAF